MKKGKKSSKTPDASRQLAQLHSDFLKSPKTLELWSGKTLKERSILFHRKFPNKKIAVTSLRKFYLKNKIKRKKVRQQKYLPPYLAAEFQSKCRELLDALSEARQQQRTVIYLDEVNFTKLSFQDEDWSGKSTSLTVD